MVDPVLMGAVEQKLVEALLRLQEAFKIMNHLKKRNGYEVTSLSKLQQTCHLPGSIPSVPPECDT